MNEYGVGRFGYRAKRRSPMRFLLFTTGKVGVNLWGASNLIRRAVSVSC